MARPSLPDILLDRIRNAYEGGELVRRIAAEFGVSTRTIERHARASRWDRTHDNRRVDPQLMARCRALYCEGALPVPEIERRTGVARATIYRWIRQYPWRP
jgi:transposase-like protein